MINVKWIWDTLLGALRLDGTVLEEMRDASDGFKQGLTFIVALALVVGLVVGAVGFFRDLQSDPASDMDAAFTDMEEAFKQMEDFGTFGDDEVKLDDILANIEAGMTMGKDIAGVVEDTTAAPMSVVYVFNAIAQWLSRPFTWIGLWLAWGVMTLFFARLLGGTATIQRMLATTSLAAAPLILGVFGWVPCVGGLITLLAWLWVLVIYVKGTAVANRMGMGAALLVVLFPFIIAAVLGVLGLLTMGTLIAIAN